MNKLIWTKTLIGAYEHIEKISGAIDKIIMTHALNSAFVNLHNVTINNTLSVSERILKLTERKITLINLKVILNSVFQSIDKIYAKILILKHIDKLKSDEIAKLLKISSRSYFRKQNEAYEKFTKCLERNGHSSEKLFDMLSLETWIIEAYKTSCQNQTTNSDNIIVFDTSKINFICASLKKVSYAHWLIKH